jgi:hypothetical protein
MIVSLLWGSVGVFAQDEVILCNIERLEENVKKGGFLFWRDYRSYDLVVSWEVCDADNNDLSSRFGYRVYCWPPEEGFAYTHYAPQEIPGNRYIFENREAYKEYNVLIEVLDNENNVVVQSAPLNFYFPSGDEIDGRRQYDESIVFSILKNMEEEGWAITIIIALALIFSIFFIYLPRTRKMLNSQWLFPTQYEINEEKNDTDVTSKKAKENFDNIINEINKEVPYLCDEVKVVLPDILKQEQTIPTREDFRGGLVSSVLKILPWTSRKHLNRSEKGPLFINKLPTIKILISGFSKCIGEPSRKEVAQALYDRAGVEVDKLKRRSAIDWLWYIGFLQPLLGLFGTVIGLTRAFFEFHESGGDTIADFAGGIYTALVTTIFGLFSGVILIFCFYHSSYKLDRITTFWNQMIINVCEYIDKRITPGLKKGENG